MLLEVEGITKRYRRGSAPRQRRRQPDGRVGTGLRAPGPQRRRQDHPGEPDRWPAQAGQRLDPDLRPRRGRGSGLCPPGLLDPAPGAGADRRPHAAPGDRDARPSSGRRGQAREGSRRSTDRGPGAEEWSGDRRCPPLRRRQAACLVLHGGRRSRTGWSSSTSRPTTSIPSGGACCGRRFGRWPTRARQSCS